MVSGSGIRAKRVVVDRHHHILDHLAPPHAQSSGVVVTKDLLNGQPTTVVHAEQTAISRIDHLTQKLKYMKFLRKRMNTQPSQGPIHYLSPAKILWLKVYEGIPPPVLRLQKGHKYSLLGQLLSEVGWNHYDTIKEEAWLKTEKSAEEKLGSQLQLLYLVTY
ncbi:unnamed protein product [Malus baccata var. baccata]